MKLSNWTDLKLLWDFSVLFLFVHIPRKSIIRCVGDFSHFLHIFSFTLIQALVFRALHWRYSLRRAFHLNGIYVFHAIHVCIAYDIMHGIPVCVNVSSFPAEYVTIMCASIHDSIDVVNAKHKIVCTEKMSSTLCHYTVEFFIFAQDSWCAWS